MRSAMVCLALVACGDPGASSVDASLADAAEAFDAWPIADAVIDAPVDAAPGAVDAMPDAPAVSPLDPTFGTNGLLELPGNVSITGIALRDTGFFTASYETLAMYSYVARIHAWTDVGTVDASYGTDGTFDLGTDYVRSPRIERLDDGSFMVIAGGIGIAGDTGGTRLTKLTVTGTIDSTFGTNGSVTLALEGSPSKPLVQTDDGYLVCGTSPFPDLARVVQVTANGEAGTTTDHGGIHCSCMGIERRGDSIYISVRARKGGFLSRIDQTGARDWTFGNVNGAYHDPVRGFGDLAIAPNGDVIAITDDATSFGGHLIRLDSTGSPRGTFGTNGRAVIVPPTGGESFSIHELVVTDADRTIVRGSVYYNFATGADSVVVAVDATGAIDSAWGRGGIVTTDLNYYDFNLKLRLRPDNTVLVSGQSRTLSDTEHTSWIFKIL